MEITGKVHEVGQTQQVTETFKKRDLIVEYAENPQYPEFIKFEASQDRVNLFDNLSVGQDITVSFNLRGRPWTNKEGVTTYFNSFVAWRVNKGQSSPKESIPAPVELSYGDGADDLPF
jgi:hypothetical protein